MNAQTFRTRLARQRYGEPRAGEYDVGMSNDKHTHDFAFSALALEGELILTTARVPPA